MLDVLYMQIIHAALSVYAGGSSKKMYTGAMLFLNGLLVAYVPEDEVEEVIAEFVSHLTKKAEKKIVYESYVV